MEQTVKKSNFSSHKLKAQISLHAMLIPAVVFAIIFSIIPLFGLVMAFQDTTTGDMFHATFIGFRKFELLFMRKDFPVALSNTVIIALLKIFFTTILSIIFALLINEVQNPLFKKFIQTTIFLPYFLSWILIGSIFVEMFSLTGAVNSVLSMFGIQGEYWITDDRYFRGIVVLTDLWKNLGYQVVVFLAAITTINSNLYEAAEIDGAGHIQKCWHITLPGIKPMIVLMCILNIGNIMNAGFEQILVMYNPSVLDTGEILDTMSYTIGLIDKDFAMGTAIGLFKSIISCVCFIIAYRIAFKVSDYRLF
jgi:putative aldouronate transport system permease protein